MRMVGDPQPRRWWCFGEGGDEAIDVRVNMVSRRIMTKHRVLPSHQPNIITQRSAFEINILSIKILVGVEPYLSLFWWTSFIYTNVLLVYNSFCLHKTYGNSKIIPCYCVQNRTNTFGAFYIPMNNLSCASLHTFPQIIVSI